MRYGVPYKGSKNSIAEWVYSHFPKADNFYDLFAGGCAITHYALIQNNYKRYFLNDISDIPQLFLDAIKGKFKNEKRWISREDFNRLKNQELYIRYCWSFGNRGQEYLYSKELEPYKKAVHIAIMENDNTLLNKAFPGYDFSFLDNISDKKLKRLTLQSFMKNRRVGYDTPMMSCIDVMEISQNIARLQGLEALESLERLESFNTSYENIKILPNSIIYCDIPYFETDNYGNNFDYERFYSWCEKQTEPLFISEYWMPEDRFECIDEIEKTVTLQSGAGNKAIEKLFIPRHQKYDKWQGTLFEGIL